MMATGEVVPSLPSRQVFPDGSFSVSPGNLIVVGFYGIVRPVWDGRALTRRPPAGFCTFCGRRCKTATATIPEQVDLHSLTCWVIIYLTGPWLPMARANRETPTASSPQTLTTRLRYNERRGLANPGAREWTIGGSPPS